MLRLFLPLVIVKLGIPGLISRGTAFFVQNDTNIILPDDIRRATKELLCRKPATHFGAKLEARRKKHVSYFSLYTIWCDICNCNPFKLKANTISSEKSCQISIPFLLTCIDVRAVKFIPLPESWLASKLKFPAHQPYVRLFSGMGIPV